MTTVSLAGKVVALAGSGSDADRAAAIGCAEAGADLALATLTTDQAAEFGMNSIANEAWVLGSEQFVRVMDATDTAAVAAFVEETWARYGGCDAFVVTAATPRGLAEAFARRMGESGGGVVVFVGDEDGEHPSELGGVAGIAIRLVASAADVASDIANPG